MKRNQMRNVDLSINAIVLQHTRKLQTILTKTAPILSEMSKLYLLAPMTVTMTHQKLSRINEAGLLGVFLLSLPITPISGYLIALPHCLFLLTCAAQLPWRWKNSRYPHNFVMLKSTFYADVRNVNNCSFRRLFVRVIAFSHGNVLFGFYFE